jgi:hypothetical protein
VVTCSTSLNNLNSNVTLGSFLLTLMYLALGSLVMVPPSTSALLLTSLPLHFMCLPSLLTLLTVLKGFHLCFGTRKVGCRCSRSQKAFGTTKTLQKCWLEDDWENVMDQGQVMRVKLLNNYGCLVFDDIDSTPPVCMRVSTTKLKCIKRSG